MSLGLGLAVLVTITQIDGNLRRQFLAALPDRAPSFYFIDIPTADADRFGAFLRQAAPESTVEDVPMLRGRIVACPRRQGRGAQAFGRCRMGAAKRPRPDLYRRNPQGLENRRGRMVGRRLWRAAAGLHGEEDRRRLEARRSATRSSSTCLAATFRPKSPICATSTGRGSASISCWCSRRMPSRAPRIAMSRP